MAPLRRFALSLYLLFTVLNDYESKKKSHILGCLLRAVIEGPIGESARLVIASLRPGEYMASMDIQECSHSLNSSAIFALFSGRQPIPVLCTTLQPFLCTQGVHKGLGFLACPFQNSVHPSRSLSRLPGLEDFMFFAMSKNVQKISGHIPSRKEHFFL